MEAITITIYPASEGGYMYQIYNKDLDALGEILASEFAPDGESPEAEVSGHCLATLAETVERAASQVEDLINRNT